MGCVDFRAEETVTRLAGGDTGKPCFFIALAINTVEVRHATCFCCFTGILKNVFVLCRRETVSNPIALSIWPLMLKKNKPAAGFTLVELVVILIVVGVLAIAALPRFFDQNDFYARGFYDETLSILRYGQKTAVAQRRVVCASFTATSVTLRVATNFGGVCDKDLTGPNGGTPYQVSARGSVQFSPLPSALSFNPDGSASAGASIQVSGASGVISVIKETGHVY